MFHSYVSPSFYNVPFLRFRLVWITRATGYCCTSLLHSLGELGEEGEEGGTLVWAAHDAISFMPPGGKAIH